VRGVILEHVGLDKVSIQTLVGDQLHVKLRQ
jgi:hypothetical protein